MDVAEQDAAIAAYWAEADVEAGVEPAPAGAPHTQDLDELSGTSAKTIPMSWTAQDCDSDGHEDVQVWDADDRVAFSSPPAHNESALWFVKAAVGPFVDVCSGVKVGSRHVLTAAHCVTDEKGKLLTRTRGIRVCSNPSTPHALCHRISDLPGGVTVAPGWAASQADGFDVADVRHDWAILALPDGLADPKMYFSELSRSDVSKSSTERVGNDDFRGGCLQFAHQVYHPTVPVRGTDLGLVRTRGDGSESGSGGPLYHVPTGLTAGRILGVFAMAHSVSVSGTIVSGFTGGPRVTEFRKLAISIVEDGS